MNTNTHPYRNFLQSFFPAKLGTDNMLYLAEGNVNTTVIQNENEDLLESQIEEKPILTMEEKIEVLTLLQFIDPSMDHINMVLDSIDSKSPIE